MLHHHVWRRHQMQRLALVAQLPARLPAASAPQALGLAWQSVARRGLAAVVSVLGQRALQRLHLIGQRRHVLPQG